MTDTVEKVRENRLRRVAERRGLRLEKSRRRDSQAIDYGTYQLVDAGSGAIVSVGGGPLNLDAVERQLAFGNAFYRANAGCHVDAEAGSTIVVKPGVVLVIASTRQKLISHVDGSLRTLSA